MLEVRDIHVPLMAFLDKEGIPYERNRSDKKSTSKNGTPDFLITLASRCLYIECKIPGNKLSPAQEKRIADLRKAGNRVEVCYSLEAAVEAVRDWAGVVGMAHIWIDFENGSMCSRCCVSIPKGTEKPTGLCKSRAGVLTLPEGKNALQAKAEGLKEASPATRDPTQKGSQPDPVTNLSGSTEGRAQPVFGDDIRPGTTDVSHPSENQASPAQSLSEQEKAPSVSDRGGSDVGGVSPESLPPPGFKLCIGQHPTGERLVQWGNELWVADDRNLLRVATQADRFNLLGKS